MPYRPEPNGCITAAAQGMYSLAQYPVDHEFWTLRAYCVGTGGSTLVIGSAAGVVAMGMERVDESHSSHAT